MNKDIPYNDYYARETADYTPFMKLFSYKAYKI